MIGAARRWGWAARLVTYWAALAAPSLSCTKRTVMSDSKTQPRGAGGAGTLHIAQLEGEPVVIPEFDRPADLPYSQWEEHDLRQLLQANGYGATPAEWRRAAASSVWAVRDGAFALLARRSDPADAALFRRGQEDESPLTRVWAAYGLLRTGDADARAALEARSRDGQGTHLPAALSAARLLGELGDARAYQIIEQAMQAGKARYRVVMNALPFAALHGRPYAPGRNIDIWAFYDAALRDPDERTQNVALAQLAELRDPAAAPLLRAFLGRGPAPAMRARAERVLKALPQ